MRHANQTTIRALVFFFDFVEIGICVFVYLV